MLKRIFLFIICLLPVSKAVYAVGTSAQSSILINAQTRQVLYQNNSRQRLGIASTTKIMTALVALEEGNTTDIFTVSENAQNQEGSSIYLRKGEKVSLGDLLYGLMLNSGNDAAVAIAEGVSGSCEEFVSRMNAKAEEIGCKNTHFANPNGLSNPEHYSTAYDMALIMASAMENDEFKKIVSTREYKITTESAETYLKNHNKLLWRYEYCTGGKTGFTKATGRCFVSSSKRDNCELIAVTLNDRDDWNDHIALHEYGFDRLREVSAISRNDILCMRRINGSKVNVLAGEDFKIALEGGNKHGMSVKIRLKQLNGPINYGTHIGTGDIYVNDFKVGSIPLVSGQSVSKCSKSDFFETLGEVLSGTLLKN